MSNQETETPETHPNDQNNAQCNTEVYLGKPSGNGIWGNYRGLHTLRCDDMLWIAFRRATKAVGTSICSELETMIVGWLGFYSQVAENKVHFGNTYEFEQTVYRNTRRDRRNANPKFVTERDVNDNEIGDLESLADPFVDYYASHPSLDPSAQTLYRDFVKEGLELDWEVKQALARARIV